MHFDLDLPPSVNLMEQESDFIRLLKMVLYCLTIEAADHFAEDLVF